MCTNNVFIVKIMKQMRKGIVGNNNIQEKDKVIFTLIFYQVREKIFDCMLKDIFDTCND